MQKAGEFEKVSFEQFLSDVKRNDFTAWMADEEVRRVWEKLSLPTRATAGSAGYDIRTPFPFTIDPGQSVKVPTGIRARMDNGWVLLFCPKSGIGFKHQVWLANTVGVIDSDYYGSSNEGHIFLKLVNGGNSSFHADEGDGVAQGIFLPFGVTYSDAAEGKRNGGFGSTGK